MNTIKSESIIEFVEKKSKFIGYIKPVNTVQEAKQYIDSIKQLHNTATHNIPLYRVIENGQEYFKYNDDGEPSGTAGKPMADLVERKGVYNIAMVATRYFGGIKLGAGGLIRNYARVSKNLLESCEIIEYIQKDVFLLVVDYTNIDYVERLIKENDVELIEKTYFDNVNLKIRIKSDKIDIFENVAQIISL